MNKLNARTPSFMNPAAVQPDTSIQVVEQERGHRLIVLIPPDSDVTNVTRRICKLATESNAEVQLLGVCKDVNQELALRRELVTVSALIRNANVFVDMSVEVGTNWLEAVRHNYQHGDMILCVADPFLGIRHRPLSQLLESTLQAPMYILSETETREPQSNLISQVIAWSGFLGIIIGFFILQMKITQLPDDWFQTLLFVVVLIPELGLIWLWNTLFS